MYFLMMPLSFSGGSQETNTTELLEAAAFTPAGGPGTSEEENTVRVSGAHVNILNMYDYDILVLYVILNKQYLHYSLGCSISRPKIV